jgi:6-phospho 3-hexuloisomerase
VAAIEKATRMARQSLAYVQDHARSVLDRVDPQALDDFVNALTQARRVFVYGTGRSGLVARAFGVRLAHLGYTTYVIGETITAPVHAKDLVVLVSGSGETYPVVMTAEIARDIGAKVCVLTARPASRLAQHADVLLRLDADVEDEAKRARLAPLGTIFEVSAWLLLDGVVGDLMNRRNQTEEMMRQRHATLE